MVHEISEIWMDRFEVDDTLNAVLSVTSRSFSLQQNEPSVIRQVSMVPCGDLFNHADIDKVSVTYKLEDNALTFRTRGPCKKGDELFISYGDKSHEDLFFQYGFFISDSPRNFVRLSLFQLDVMQNPIKQFLVQKFAVDSGKIKLTNEGLNEQHLALVRAISVPNEELTSYNLGRIFGLEKSPNDECETNAALLLENLVFQELLKYKEVLENNDYIHGQLDDLFRVNIKILAKAWKRTRDFN